MKVVPKIEDEKVDDPEIIFERFKKAVATIAAAPKRASVNGAQGKQATKQPRKKRTHK